MSSTIEMLVNKQTIYRWLFNRLCYQAVVPDPTHRCCFPPAAVPRVLPRRPSLPSPAEFQLLEVYVLLPPPRRSSPVPKVLAFPGLLFGGAGCGACHPLCALCLRASSHPEELQSGTRALCLTAGMFCIY